MRRVLVLGGTTEAARLTERLVEVDGIHTTMSLAGRTARPAAGPGARRVGGFGGAEGLASHLRDAGVDLLVDATHPFATTISANAVAAAAEADTPLVRLCRAAWSPEPGDDWHPVADEREAAAALPAGARAFLALGAGRLSAFRSRPDLVFVVRTVDPPALPLLAGPHEVVNGRGPFDTAAETALLERLAVTHLVARNSGGSGAYAKLEAARTLALPVLMIARPPAPRPDAETVEDALALVMSRLS